MKVVFLLFFASLCTVFSQAQMVHHQMTSSQGASDRLANNVFVQQSIGQQSAVGNYLGSSFSVGQGFQQGKISKGKASPESSIQLTAFPNPFTSSLNFQFSAFIDGFITISIYDVMGRLVLTSEKELINNMISLDNLIFPNGQYVAELSTKKASFTINILKMR
jgi:hypothetical protein